VGFGNLPLHLHLTFLKVTARNLILMPAITATAPAKIILFGEHAVVYGRPAIAVPVMEVKARAIVRAEPRAAPGSIQIDAPALNLSSAYDELPADHPLATAVRLSLEALNIRHAPALSLRVTSTIPIAAGMGSGAAVTVAVLRALSAFLGRPLPDEQVCELAYQVERLYHGNPSGIDNSTITYARPVYFTRGQPIQTLQVGETFTIVIGDTGMPSPTARSVGDVRCAWEAETERFEALFDSIGHLVGEARQAIETGDKAALGPLMDENQRLLVEMGVSSEELDHLVQSAREAGALGAKLSGGGRGGNMIALATPASARGVEQALKEAGATYTLVTEIRKNQESL
jgi:mevalonate kinase